MLYYTLGKVIGKFNFVPTETFGTKVVSSIAKYFYETTIFSIDAFIISTLAGAIVGGGLMSQSNYKDDTGIMIGLVGGFTTASLFHSTFVCLINVVVIVRIASRLYKNTLKIVAPLKNL